MNISIKNITSFFLALTLSLSASHIFANEIDKQITAISQNPNAVAKGKELYMQACAACHGKNLEGATGFNLKDGEWVHGEAPFEILNNVKNGFNNAGMPAFGSMFSEQQLQEVVAFILGERQGLADLRYNIYQMINEKDTEITANKLIKTGLAPKNLMDFDLPEIAQYALEFEGYLYGPDGGGKLLIEIWNPGPMTLEIDGVEVPRKHPNRYIWEIKPGKQKITFRYIVGRDKNRSKRNLALFVTTPDMGIKLFGISTRAQAIMNKSNVHVKAENDIVVQRKKIHNLPPYSVSIGFPEKMNYAFNTRSCAIVGLWTGDLLNVGPNVQHRGKDGSIILGEWLFNMSSPLELMGVSKCDYTQMSKGGAPQFYFSLDAVDYKLTTSNVSANTISFNYETLSSQGKKLRFSLPTSGKVNISSTDGEIKGGVLHVDANTRSFSILVSTK